MAHPTWVAGFVPPAGNGAPNAPTLNAPANGGTGVGLSPTLSIGVSDPDADPLTVTYLRPPARERQLRPDRPAHRRRLGHERHRDLGEPRRRPDLRVVCDRQRRHPTTTGPTWTFHTTPSADPVFVGVGDIAACTNTNDTDTAAVIQGVDGNVFTDWRQRLSETAPRPISRTATHPAWGIPSIKSRTRPIPGNHDWNTGNLNGYNGYFGAAATDAERQELLQLRHPVQQLAHRQPRQRVRQRARRLRRRLPQELWLKADLAANSTKNVIALWHKPLFSSAGSHLTDLQPFVNDLYAAGADLVMDGHDHVYETIAPLDASGHRMPRTAFGTSRSGPAGTAIRASAPRSPAARFAKATRTAS